MSLNLTVFAVKPEPVVPNPGRPALTEEEIERKCKSIIDEFLHINDYKVKLSPVISLVASVFG